jgi:hypothetical protein
MFESLPEFLWTYAQIGAAWATFIAFACWFLRENPRIEEVNVKDWLLIALLWPYAIWLTIRAVIRGIGA